MGFQSRLGEGILQGYVSAGLLCAHEVDLGCEGAQDLILLMLSLLATQRILKELSVGAASQPLALLVSASVVASLDEAEARKDGTKLLLLVLICVARVKSLKEFLPLVLLHHKVEGRAAIVDVDALLL